MALPGKCPKWFSLRQFPHTPVKHFEQKYNFEFTKQSLDLSIKLLRKDIVEKIKGITSKIKEKNNTESHQSEALSPIILYLKTVDPNIKVIPDTYLHSLYSYMVKEDKFYVTNFKEQIGSFNNIHNQTLVKYYNY